MILVTHAIAGTALTRRFHSYIFIVLAGVASHYIFDMIPHWHYPTPVIRRALDDTPYTPLTLSSKLYADFLSIMIDAAVGFFFSLYFFQGNPFAISFAVAGAIMPDMLVGFFKFFPDQKLLRLHYQFHKRVHAKIRLDDRPILGIGSQAAIALFLILLFR